MTDFAAKRCIPCEGIGKALTATEVLALLPSIKDWQIHNDGKSIYRHLELKSFVEVINLVNKIKDIAEEQMHHPDIHITRYKHLEIVLFTHALNGVTENDFIVAAKINEVC